MHCKEQFYERFKNAAAKGFFFFGKVSPSGTVREHNEQIPKAERAVYLWRPAGRCAYERRRAHRRGCVQAPFPFVLVNSISFCFWQLQEVLHSPKVYQQGLRGSLGILFFSEDF